MEAQKELFEDKSGHVPIAPGAVLLAGLAAPLTAELLETVARLSNISPFRHMVTPGGWRMSAALTNCGDIGWITDHTGYRYDHIDPKTSRPWPALPALFFDLARRAASQAGFANFEPDACLMNRYAPGARLSLHQDKNERDFSHPIVSVSLGLPATFLFGSANRADRPKRIELRHGDIVVWGGPARMTYHGVDSLDDGEHPATGRASLQPDIPAGLVMPRLSIRLEFAEGSMIGPQDVRLLEEVARRRSIMAASRVLGSSYATTWRRICTINGCLRAPVVNVEVGGPTGGSAVLTSRGQMLVRLFRLAERNALAATKAELKAHKLLR